MQYRNAWKRATAVAVAAMALFLHSRFLFAQEPITQAPSENRASSAASLSSELSYDKQFWFARDSAVAQLPDAPVPQDQSQSASPSARPELGILDTQPVVSPRASREPLTSGEKLSIYLHQTFGPPAVVLPAFGAGLRMLNPPKNYPRDWKYGADAFGRLYGDKLATNTSRRTGRFLAETVFHEDPRYVPSSSKNAFGRTLHALAFTVVDRTDSGRNTFAIGNFAGAAAGGFVGMAYLPNGYSDITHAEQRMAAEFATFAIGNVAAEFEPQWGPVAKKLRIPKILPRWWIHDGQSEP
jgi:hypothetical protein